MTKVFPVKAIEVELYQPLIDWDTSPIQAIFIQKSKENIWEVSLIFADEVHPWYIGYWLSLLYRKILFHRKKDIETFFVKSLSNKKVKVSFFNTYSGSYTFFAKITFHKTKQFIIKIDKNFIKVYINTWNHLMSIKDNNPKLEKITCYLDLSLHTKRARCFKKKDFFVTIPVFYGSRKDAEFFVKYKKQ